MSLGSVGTRCWVVYLPGNHNEDPLFLQVKEAEGKVKGGVGHYYVRQLRDMKGSPDYAPGETDIENFIEQCGLSGWALALAHAKTGDPAMIAGYVGKSEALDEAIARFALAYADQTERDYETLSKAARAHRIRVARER